MPVLNCWQVKQCGREPGGARAKELGVCPAVRGGRADQMNHGHNGGRVCYALTGTLCGGKVQGTFAMKLSSCLACDFYKQVVSEEGRSLVSTKDILARLA